MIHSDQGSQFSSSDWQSFLKANNVISSMSRRGNCHDNAVAESFFQLLKRERIRRKIYATRDEALIGGQLSARELVDVVTTKLHKGVQLVVEDSILEPWLQRFQAASVGPTRLAEGPYLLDFEQFVEVWHQELEHLNIHRAHRFSTRSQ